MINDAEAATSTWGDPASWHSNADPTIPHVVINEVARHPINGEVEKIELRNLAAETADISGWYITDNLGDLSYQIPTGTVIPAGATFFTSGMLIHIFIDAMTAYGTGWFEPFTHVRVSFISMFDSTKIEILFIINTFIYSASCFEISLTYKICIILSHII